jgi:orotate phosphoribosyltransferase
MSVQEQVARLLNRREGHFALESGHHGDLWLDLERLFLDPRQVEPLASALADRLASQRIEAVCGPLVEGAFVGLMVASALGVSFTYSERVADPQPRALFPFRYRIPDALRAELRGSGVAVANDDQRGSAVRGTLDDLDACGARRSRSRRWRCSATRRRSPRIAASRSRRWRRFEPALGAGGMLLCARGAPLAPFSP